MARHKKSNLQRNLFIILGILIITSIVFFGISQSITGPSLITSDLIYTSPDLQIDTTNDLGETNAGIDIEVLGDLELPSDTESFTFAAGMTFKSDNEVPGNSQGDLNLNIWNFQTGNWESVYEQSVTLPDSTQYYKDALQSFFRNDNPDYQFLRELEDIEDNKYHRYYWCASGFSESQIPAHRSDVTRQGSKWIRNDGVKEYTYVCLDENGIDGLAEFDWGERSTAVTFRVVPRHTYSNDYSQDGKAKFKAIVKGSTTMESSAYGLAQIKLLDVILLEEEVIQENETEFEEDQDDLEDEEITEIIQTEIACSSNVECISACSSNQIPTCSNNLCYCEVIDSERSNLIPTLIIGGSIFLVLIAGFFLFRGRK